MKKKSKNRYSLISYFFILIAIILFSFPGKIGGIPFFSQTISLPHYDSQAIDLTLHQPRQADAHRSQGLKTLEISGEFKIASNKHQPPYFDLFHTSPYNAGVRLEFMKIDTGDYVASLLFKNEHLPEHFKVFPMGKVPVFFFKPGITYHYVLKVDKDETLFYEIYQKNNKSNYVSDTIKNDFSEYQIDHLMLGGGFDQSRNFIGEIHDFSIKYTYLIPTYLEKFENTLILFFLIAGLFIAGYGNRTTIKNVRLPWLYFILLSFIFSYPILQLYAVNLINVTGWVVIKNIFFISLFAIMILIALTYAYKDENKALLFSIILSIALFFGGRAYHAFFYRLSSDEFVFFAAMGLLVIYIFILHLPLFNKKFTALLKNLVYLFFTMSLICVAYNKAALALTSEQTAQTSQTTTTATSNDLDKPDIYFILTDMHASQISLKKHLSDDNGSFIQKLKSLGFYIANNATSNYKYTILSLPSMLNLNFISPSVNKAETMKNNYDRNQMATGLKKLGYQFIFISPRRYIIDQSSLADVNMTCSQLSDFEGMLWDYSLFFRLNKFGSTYRKDILCGLENIKRSALMKGPKFVFAHILSPHPPYVFDKNGNEVPLEEQRDFKTSATSYELNKKGYLGQVQFISKQLVSTVEFILAHSQKTPIIILQGDHGFSLYDSADLAAGKARPSADLVNARMRVLGAYLFPRGGNEVLYDRITPINMTRGLFRFYFHRTDLPVLEDKLFWSPEEHLFKFSDVTPEARKQDQTLS